MNYSGKKDYLVTFKDLSTLVVTADTKHEIRKDFDTYKDIIEIEVLGEHVSGAKKDKIRMLEGYINELQLLLKKHEGNNDEKRYDIIKELIDSNTKYKDDLTVGINQPNQ